MTEYQKKLYLSTVQRLKRMGIADDPVALTIALSEEIEQYRSKIRVLTAALESQDRWVPEVIQHSRVLIDPSAETLRFFERRTAEEIGYYLLDNGFIKFESRSIFNNGMGVPQIQYVGRVYACKPREEAEE